MIYILNSKNSAFYTLHALGADIWQYIYKDYSYDMILKSLYREYEVEKSVLKADLDSFFNQLYANELLFKEDGEQRDRNSNLGFAEDSLVNNAAEVFDFEVDTYDNIFSLAVNNNTLMCLTIELLDKCNWRCSHCYIPDHVNSGFSTKEVFSILDQAHEMGTFEVILTGGEIFLRDDIFDIIIKARSLHMRVYLFTNVSLLDEVKIKRLQKMHIAMVSCTIFSLERSIHDKITGVKGSLDSSLANLSLLKKYGIPVEVKTIVMCENLGSYKDVKKYCDQYGFTYIATSTVFAKKDGDKNPCHMQVKGEALEGITGELDEIIGFKTISVKLDDYMCPSLHFSLGIDCNGDVFPCSTLRRKVGNIHQSSLYGRQT